MSLNNNQILAVEAGDGPALIIAGPGSGKTTVITHRIKFLIENHNISPDKILVITFTKQAALEMSERFLNLMNNEYVPVSFGTFHAIFYQMILSLVGSDKVNLIKDKEKFDILRNLFSENNKLCLDSSYFAELLKEFSMIKNKGIDVNDHNSMLLEKDKFEYLFNEYNKRMREAGKIDFDDMCVRCLELLNENKVFLSSWQERFKYILVDEFQDINPLQYDIVRLLGAKYNNVFVVGDDDQSIYSFRGASPSMMFKFLDDFKKAIRIDLSINYRCNEDIVDKASKLIKKNKNRFDKKIEANSKDKGGLIIKKFDSIHNEYEGIKEYILELKKQNKLNNTALLYRTNNVPMQFLNILRKENIPFRLKEKPVSLMDSFIFKDICAYFELADGKLTKANLLRIMNKPVRYISRDFIDNSLMRYSFFDKRINANNNKDFDFEFLLKNSLSKKYLYQNIYSLYKDLDSIKKMEPYLAFNFILKRIGYEEYLAKYAYEKNINFEDFRTILDNIKHSMKEYSNYEDWYRNILLQDEIINKRINENDNKDGMIIMTMHSSKGLEWDNVILPDINEKIVPYKKAKTFEQIEEERRSLYVAMTRARTNLFISYVDCKEEDMRVSGFIKDMSML